MSKPWDGRANPFNAYYYSLEPTGVEPVDSILKALAYAGKAYHSTSQWTDDHPVSCIDLIQAEANAAAKRITALEEMIERMCNRFDGPIGIVEAIALINEARALKAGSQ